MNVYVVLRWRWRDGVKSMRPRWQVQLVICRSHQPHASLNMVRGRTTPYAWGYIFTEIIQVPLRTLVVYLPRSFANDAFQCRRWSIGRSRRFDVSGAIVEPCYPSSTFVFFLPFMDITLTLETQTSQKKVLQLIEANNTPIVLCIAHLVCCMSFLAFLALFATCNLYITRMTL